MISPQKRLHGGFSLVELLVVILIISLLLTLGAVGLRGMTGGNGVGAAVATSEAIFDEARSIAVGKGTKARVLVDVTNPQDNENYLRRLLVAFQKLDAQGEPTDEWELASRALSLPEKTFFSRVYSKKDHEGDSGEIDTMQLSINKRAFDGEYFFYEFNSEGICSNPGASFVVVPPAKSRGQRAKGSAMSPASSSGGTAAPRFSAVPTRSAFLPT